MGKQSLLDRIAIVTGASSGIGREIALALADEGVHIVLAARDEQRLAAVAKEIENRGREAFIVPTDMTQQAQVEQMVSESLDRWDRVDILVANAGVYVRSPITQLSVTDVERSLAINFYGSLYPTLAVLPSMLARGSGHLVYITSVDGKKGIPPDAPYAAAKFALTGFAEVLRQELHGTGVYATNILPGRVDTPMIGSLRVPWISAKIPPQAVARAALRAIKRKSPEVVLPFSAKLLVYANTLSPAFGDWFVRMFHLEGWEMPEGQLH